MIPKIIHYCWFGGKDKPTEFYKMLETWRLYLPDYKICEWNETNFDTNICRYSREAYLSGNYAHVSDVCRVYALLNCGGIYLDTDVEVRSSFDPFLKYDSFLSSEHNQIGTAVIGACKGSKWLEVFMDYYKKHHFINMWGHPVRTPNTKILTRDIIPRLKQCERPVIFPDEIFCGKDFWTGKLIANENTVCIHHYMASWKRKRTLRQKIATICRGFIIRYFK